MGGPSSVVGGAGSPPEKKKQNPYVIRRAEAKMCVRHGTSICKLKFAGGSTTGATAVRVLIFSEMLSGSVSGKNPAKLHSGLAHAKSYIACV